MKQDANGSERTHGMFETVPGVFYSHLFLACPTFLKPWGKILFRDSFPSIAHSLVGIIPVRHSYF